MSQILVIVAIALAIFMLPRLAGKRSEQNGKPSSIVPKMNGWTRLAVVASVVWTAALGFYVKPWQGHWPLFFYIAIGPLVLFWGIFWVLQGFRKGKPDR